MTENDDILVRNFLQAGKQEVADHGFSRRVMKNLPDRRSRWGLFLQLACTTAALILFFLNNGLHILRMTLLSVIQGIDYHVFNNVSLKSALMAGILLTVIGIFRFCENQLNKPI